MANYICIDSVEEQVNYLIDKVKDLKTNKLDKTAVVQETGTGTDVVMSQKAVTDAIANKGLDTLTGVNLTLGDTRVDYDTTNGIQLNSTARFTDGAGNHDATMDLALPVVGKDGIVIDKAADSEKIEISGNYVKKNPAKDRFVYGKNVVNSTLQETVYYVDQGNFSQVGRIPCWIAPDSSHTLASVNNPVTAKVSTPVGEADIANKKYVDDNFVKKPEPYVIDALIAIHANGDIFVKHIDDLGSVPSTVAQVYTNDAGDTKPYSTGVLITNDPVQPYQCANKKYVDDAIASISPTTNTKYEHNLVLEGTQLGSTFKAFMSIPRSDDTAITSLDEIVAILGSAAHSCTGYIYDGNQKSFSIVSFNPAGPGFEYNDPETGGQVFSVANDEVTVTDDTIPY